MTLCMKGRKGERQERNREGVKGGGGGGEGGECVCRLLSITTGYTKVYTTALQQSSLWLVQGVCVGRGGGGWHSRQIPIYMYIQSCTWQ